MEEKSELALRSGRFLRDMKFKLEAAKEVCGQEIENSNNLALQLFNDLQ
jgi:hypothetical protein